MDEQSQLGRPVYYLQVMLRELSYHNTTIPRLVPDGVFGLETQTAVQRFQKSARLPTTGQVDNITWDAIVLAYTKYSNILQAPLRTNGFPDRLYTIAPGENSIFLMMIQAMFNALFYVLEDIQPVLVDGQYTDNLGANILWLQRLAGLDETGIIGKHEWDLLTRIYDIFLIRSIDPEPTIYR